MPGWLVWGGGAGGNVGMKEQWIPENYGIRVERKEINGIRQVDKGREDLCVYN